MEIFPVRREVGQCEQEQDSIQCEDTARGKNSLEEGSKRKPIVPKKRNSLKPVPHGRELLLQTLNCFRSQNGTIIELFC